MRSYAVTITGKTPLLMHSDNIEWADKMEVWKNNPENRKHSKAGDDRSPAFRWLGSLYHDNERVSIPSENLMACIMEGGAMVPVPGGRSGKTFKAQKQSGMIVAEPFWPLLVGGKEVPVASIMALLEEKDFQKHQDLAAKYKFTLFVKRAKIGASKHIRVRPRFDSWQASGRINAWDDQLTLPVLKDVPTYARP